MNSCMKMFGVIILSVVLSACGGSGGGGGGTANSGKTYSLQKRYTTEVGPVYSSAVSATFSNGDTYTGTLDIVNLAQEMLQGVLVTPQQTTYNLTDGVTPIQIVYTEYTDTNGLLIALQKKKGGLCNSFSPDSPPLSVKIGDSGTRSDLGCENYDVIKSQWRVEDGGNDNAIYIVSEQIISSNIKSIDNERSLTVNEAGDILNVKLVVTFKSGSTYTIETI